MPEGKITDNDWNVLKVSLSCLTKPLDGTSINFDEVSKILVLKSRKTAQDRFNQVKKKLLAGSPKVEENTGVQKRRRTPKAVKSKKDLEEEETNVETEKTSERTEQDDASRSQSSHSMSEATDE